MKLSLFTGMFFLLHLIPQVSSAQSKWYKGIIITNKGDTTTGFISYSNSRLNPRLIYFANTATGSESKPFTPADIKGFIIEGEQPFLSYIGPVSTNATEIGKIPYTNERDLSKINNIKNDMVFLGQLVAGNTSLYELEDFKQHFFLRGADNIVFELQNKFYMVPGGIEFKMNDRVYLRQLDSFLQSNNINTVPNADLEKTAYRKKDLSKLVLLINGVPGNSVKTAVYKKRKTEQRLGAGGGIGFLSTSYNYFVKRENKSTALQAYLYYDIAGIFDLNNFFCRMESRYSQLNMTINDVHTGYTQKYTAGVAGLSIIPSFNYSIIKYAALEIYAGLGININFSLKRTGARWNFTDTLYRNSIPFEVVDYADDHDIKWVWPCLSLHAGAVFAKKIDLNISYDLPSTASVPGSNAGVIRLKLLALKLNYAFGL